MQEHKFVDRDEMRAALRGALAADPERSLLVQLLRTVRDPAGPGTRGRNMPHPLWLALVVIAVVAAGVFLLFSLFGP